MRSRANSPTRAGHGRGTKRPRRIHRIVPPIVDPAPLDDPAEPSDLDDLDLPALDDDTHWDVFIADDDERDPLPDPGDFWNGTERGARSEEPN